MDGMDSNGDPGRSRDAMLFRIFLIILAISLLVGLFACASGGNDRSGGVDEQVEDVSVSGKPVRMLLVRSDALDSIHVVNEFFMDQAIRKATDSIDKVDFVTLNYRDSLLRIADEEGKEGLPVSELAKQLAIDKVVATRVARFGSMLGLDFRVIDPETDSVEFRELVFSFIRYRQDEGTLLVGPALYDAVRKAVGRYAGVPHTDSLPIATVPLVVSGVEISREEGMGRVSDVREKASLTGVRSMGDYARLYFPELVVFDYESRERVYQTVGVSIVENFMPVTDVERNALFNLGINHYLIGKIRGAEGDSLEVRTEIRYVVSPRQDTLIDSEQKRYPVLGFEAASVVDDISVALIDVAEPMLKRWSERIRLDYEARAGK